MNVFKENPDFYPTPQAVIEQMLLGENIIGKTVLEPSAGKGNIVDHLKLNGAGNVIACENDPNIRKLLNGKCEIIAEDFLTVTSDMVSHVDYIIMNPPFSQGAKHILHAWEIAPAGCVIIALSNSSVFETWRTESRTLRETVQLYGNSEYLGNVFKNSERTTDVSVSLIKLYKEGAGDNEFEGYFFSSVDEDAANHNQQEGIMSYNVIRDLVNRYVSAVKLFDETMAATKLINDTARYVDFTTDADGNTHKKSYDYLPIKFGATTGHECQTEVTHEQYKKALQKYYWHIIFDKLDMKKYATQKLKEQINKFIEQQQNIPFTMGNIYRVIDIVVQTHGQRMQNALQEAFDLICSFSAENSTAGEKWKTNANYMVNKKFIVPFMCSTDAYYWKYSNSLHLAYSSNENSLSDVNKALCYITGTDFDTVGTLNKAVNKLSPDYGEWFEWGFFRCKGYKKGTMHFQFLNEDVWMKFNMQVAELRGWSLPKMSEKKRKK